MHMYIYIYIYSVQCSAVHGQFPQCQRTLLLLVVLSVLHISSSSSSNIIMRGIRCQRTNMFNRIDDQDGWGWLDGWMALCKLHIRNLLGWLKIP